MITKYLKVLAAAALMAITVCSIASAQPPAKWRINPYTGKIDLYISTHTDLTSTGTLTHAQLESKLVEVSAATTTLGGSVGGVGGGDNLGSGIATKTVSMGSFPIINISSAAINGSGVIYSTHPLFSVAIQTFVITASGQVEIGSDVANGAILRVFIDTSDARPEILNISRGTSTILSVAPSSFTVTSSSRIVFNAPFFGIGTNYPTYPIHSSSTLANSDANVDDPFSYYNLWVKPASQALGGHVFYGNRTVMNSTSTTFLELGLGGTGIVGYSGDIITHNNAPSDSRNFSGISLFKNGSPASAEGLFLETDIYKGGASNLYGLKYKMDASNSSGSGGNAFGVYLDLVKAAGYRLDTAYGLYVTNNLSASAAWPIYIQSTLPSFFAGSIGIGTDTPRAGAAFEIKNGSAIISGNTAALIIGSTPSVSVTLGIGSSTISGLVNLDTPTVRNRLDIANTGSFASSYTFRAGTAPVNGPYHVAITTNGAFSLAGGSPTVSSCGATPNGALVRGNNQVGEISVGAGAVTSCTLTFAPPFNFTPVCVVSDNSTATTADISAVSNTAITFGFSVSLASGRIYYQCIGNNE